MSTPRKTSRGKGKNNVKLKSDLASTAGFEPGPHWWKASALTTASPLLPNRISR